MQKPPDSALTPTMPSGQEAGAVVGRLVRLRSSGRDEPVPICSSLIFTVVAVEPSGVVSSNWTSPGDMFGVTRIGISRLVGLFVAYGLISIPCRLNFTVP